MVSEHQAGPDSEWGMKNESGYGQGCWTDRGFMMALKKSLVMHVCVNLESVKHVLLIVTFNLYQLKKRKGTWLSVLMFYVIIYVLLKEVPCLCQPVHLAMSVSSVCLCVCPCVCVSGI